MPAEYVERVYAGTLGKLVGVYLGRPFEGWTYERIMAELGEITYYVHDRRGVPLVVTDDDISGTFTFLRAMPDYGNRADLTPENIGRTWLNYIIENRTILWWGGLGKSTEHTAYLRLKAGIPAPRSGSAALNGTVIAEQIGAQIFIDGWGMIAPGDPERAADLAQRAARVSHDGEAVYAAQVIAAMEAQAFVEPRLDRLLDCGLSCIPNDSIIARLIHDLRDWHTASGDWRDARKKVADRYGYDKYPGNCHVVPNHALIVLALLYGEGDLSRSLTIVNTSGWDTDCNSGNVGCLLGIRNGLAAFEGGPDWLGPIADRMYLPTADGGRCITDAASEAIRVANVGFALTNEPPFLPKQGARFHFELPGSLQGFQVEEGNATIANMAGHSMLGSRSLAITCRGTSDRAPVRISTPVFIPPDALSMPGYALIACPTLYPGQTIRAALMSDMYNADIAHVQLVAGVYEIGGRVEQVPGPELALAPGENGDLTWRIPDTAGFPIASIGIQIRPTPSNQTVYLDALTWDGSPDVAFTCPETVSDRSTVRPPWIRAWVDAVDQFNAVKHLGFELIQNHGRGIALQGTREWTDYSVRSTVHVHLARSFGLGIRVQGLQRYYALLLCDDQTVKLVTVLDGERVLAQAEFSFALERAYDLELTVSGTRIRAHVDNTLLFDVDDPDAMLSGGAAAILCEEGRLTIQRFEVRPPEASPVRVR